MQLVILSVLVKSYEAAKAMKIELLYINIYPLFCNGLY